MAAGHTDLNAANSALRGLIFYSHVMRGDMTPYWGKMTILLTWCWRQKFYPNDNIWRFIAGM